MVLKGLEETLEPRQRETERGGRGVKAFARTLSDAGAERGVEYTQYSNECQASETEALPQPL